MGTLHMSRRSLIGAGAIGFVAPSAITTDASAQTSPFLHMPPKDSAPAREGLAEVPGAQLYYWDTGGEGPPVILLHPASGSAMIWDYQRSVLARAGFRVIAYSRRGYAKSSAFDKANPGSGSQDLLAFARALNLPRFHLVASAAGGSIATDFALSNPGMLLSLTVSSNSLGIREGEIFKAADRIRPQGWDKMPVEFRELGPSYRADNPQGTKLWLDLEHHALTGTDYRQVPTNRVSDTSLSSLRLPVLLIAGAADLITPPSISRMIAAALPQAELVIADETGHSVYWERPDLFNAAVIAHLRRNPA